MNQPFSVVMPVRDAGPHLDAAIRSVLTQTCGNFEFVIGDDGSSDGSRERARAWARRDSRIRLLEGEAALGPVGSSNLVAREARHPIVARMDADDICHPDRFRLQLKVLDEHPDAVLVGSLFDSIDARGRLTRRRDRSALVGAGRRAPCAHSSIMYRREVFERVGGYREHCSYFEDFDLYLRMARHGRMLIIPEALLLYRFSETSGRLCARAQTVEDALSYCLECIENRGAPDDRFPAARRHAIRPVAAQAIVSLGSLRLWAGHRPAILGRLLRRGALGWDRKSLYALIWAMWAATSPGTLRASLRLLVRYRDAAAGRRLGAGRIYEWLPEAVGDGAGRVMPAPPDLAAIAAARWPLASGFRRRAVPPRPFEPALEPFVRDPA